MTIELAASRKALNYAHPIDIADETMAPDHLATAWIGMDLTLLDACVGPGIDPDCRAQVNFPRLASTVKAAHKGGIDFISLGAEFKNDSSSTDAECEYDAAKTCSRLAQVSEGGVFAGVAGCPEAMDVAIDLLAAQDEGWAGLTITLATDSDFAGVEEAARNARAAGIKIAVIITNPSISAERAKIIASIADAVRLRVSDPHLAREARFAIRAAGQELGKNILVFAELGIVISGSVTAAEERALLIERMFGCQPFEGIAHVYGTIYSVADTIESWVGYGAADGIILVPASLPTDLASVLRGVLPLLDARAQINVEK
ncbi:hypothetical protein [Trueperella bialowiezensis]|uniref:FMN-dependent oxidoreductase, nitrilotriacetate monooxygenase family n=1 Tax=Trueperella bialowiezensis TaxID=312285 RepID=A0A3S4VHA2_9ACTO|nr:hypothetical protein [Trueperella bialowiezensis]VEI14050.1 FMN-dependent oxidoreductase, nitrilotriacetate monooxygenase family [Trueperella bialowiezensis]